MKLTFIVDDAWWKSNIMRKFVAPLLLVAKTTHHLGTCVQNMEKDKSKWSY